MLRSVLSLSVLVSILGSSVISATGVEKKFLFRSTDQSAVGLVPPETNALAFGDIRGSLLSASVESSVVVLGGSDERNVVPVAGTTLEICEAVTCGNVVRSSSEAVRIGPMTPFRLRMRSADVPGTSVSGGVLVDGVTSSWSVSTRGQAPFIASFRSDVDVRRGDVVVSAPAILDGYGNAPIRVGEGFEYRLCKDQGCNVASDWSSLAGDAGHGDLVQLRVVAPASYSSEISTLVQWGGVSESWSVRTQDRRSPVAFDIEDLVAARPGVQLTSGVVQLEGMVGEADFSVDVEGGHRVEVAVGNGGFGPAPATIGENASFRLRTTIDGRADGRRFASTVRVGGTSSTWSIALVDEVADEFLVADSDHAFPGGSILSRTIPVSGFDAALPLSIESLDGLEPARIRIARAGAVGEWSPGPVDIRAGESFQIEAVALDESDRDGVVVVRLGEHVSANWKVRSGRSAPLAFSLTEASAPGSTRVTTPTMTFEELTLPAEVVLPVGVLASVDNGPLGSTNSLRPGSSIRFSVVAPAGHDGEANTHRISVGGVEADWKVVAQDTWPDVYAVPVFVGEDPGSFVVSDPIVPRGYTHATAVRVTGAGSPLVSIDGGPYAASGVLSPGQSFQVRLQASSQSLERRDATISVGGREATWSVTTAGNDSDPDLSSLRLAVREGLDPAGLIVSEVLTPTGFDAAAIVSVSGEGGPQVSVMGRPWSGSVRVRPGESFQVRVTTPASFDQAREATVSMGGVSSVWTVKTRAEDRIPDAISFVDLVGQSGRSVVVSQARVPTGFKDPAPLSVVGGTMSIQEGPWVAEGTIHPGQSVRLRLTTIEPDRKKSEVVLSSGGTILATWAATTVDSTPDLPWAGEYLAQVFSEPALSTNRWSTTLRLTGFDTATQFRGGSCSADGNAAAVGLVANPIVINGTNRAAGHPLIPGDQVQLRLGVGSNSVLGQTGTCTYLLGDLEVHVRYRISEGSPETTESRQVPFHAGATPGSYVTSGRYHPFGNRAPAMVRVSSNSDYRVGGTGEWVAGGSSFRVPAGSFFEARTLVPASGRARVEIRQNENLSTAQYYDVTPNAPDTSFAATVPVDFLPASYVSSQGGGTFNIGAYRVPATGNTCWPIRVRSHDTGVSAISFRIATNVSSRNIQPDTTGPSGGANGWSRNFQVCPGELVRLVADVPVTGGQTRYSTVTIGDWSGTIAVTNDDSTLDRDPDGFSFANVTEAAGETRIVSDTLTPAGFNGSTNVSVQGEGDPAVSVAGRAWSTEPVRISPGESLRVAVSSGVSDGTSRRVTVRVGSTTSVWQVTTTNLQVSPFSFAEAIGVTPGIMVQSDEIVVDGLRGREVDAVVSGPGSPVLSVNGGVQRTSAVLRDGDRVRLATMSSGEFSASVRTTLRIGASSGVWVVTTRAASVVPSAFDVPPLAGAPLSTLVESQAVRPTGFLDEARVTVGGPEARISIDGGPWLVEGTISPGDAFVLRGRSSSSNLTPVEILVDIEGRKAVWSVTSE